MRYMRYCIITAFLCAIAPSCLAESTVAERTDTKGYCVFGAWMLVSETAPDGKETSSIFDRNGRRQWEQAGYGDEVLKDIEQQIEKAMK